MNLNLIGPNPHIDITGTFSSRGIAVIEYALPAADLAHMDAICPRLPPRTGGARAADFVPEARAWLTAHDGLLALASRLLDTPVCLTRLQAFDKSGASNWFVPWHQDRAADGQERPVVRLEASVALRIHLDDAPKTTARSISFQALTATGVSLPTPSPRASPQRRPSCAFAPAATSPRSAPC